MKHFAVFFLVLTLSASTLPSFAGKSINHRQQQQRHRIEQGVNNGRLTKPEAARLATQQKILHKKEQAYRADGKLSAKERFDLQTDQQRMSRNIYRQKHDGQNRP